MFKKGSSSFKVIGGLIAVTLVMTVVMVDALKVRVTQASVLGLPEPTAVLPVSDIYSMPVLKGLKLDVNNPLNIQFVLDTGNEDSISKEESARLVKYFMAALTVPGDSLWVNLSPYEQDRVIDENLGITDLGKDLLSQDYVLKQLTSSMTHPESETGKDFWEQTYAKLMEVAGTTNLPVDTFNKIWIMPDSIEVREENDMVIITEASLKALLEEDYLALENNISKESKTEQEEISQVSSNLIRENIVPIITDDVNNGKNFARLRQVYHSLILANWFKKKFEQSFYSNYINQAKVNGIDLEDKESKQKIYDLYVEAFQKGVYDIAKREIDPGTKEKINRRYFSGGVQMTNDVVASAITVNKGLGNGLMTAFAGTMLLLSAALSPVDAQGKEINKETVDTLEYIEQLPAMELKLPEIKFEYQKLEMVELIQEEELQPISDTLKTIELEEKSDFDLLPGGFFLQVTITEETVVDTINQINSELLKDQKDSSDTGSSAIANFVKSAIKTATPTKSLMALLAVLALTVPGVSNTYNAEQYQQASQLLQQQAQKDQLFSSLRGMGAEMTREQRADFLSGAFGVSLVDVEAGNVNKVVTDFEAGFSNSGQSDLNDYFNSQARAYQQQMINLGLFNNLKGMVEKMDSTQAADFLSSAYGVNYSDVQSGNVDNALDSLMAGYNSAKANNTDLELSDYFNQKAQAYQQRQFNKQMFDMFKNMTSQMDSVQASQMLQNGFGVSYADVQADNVDAVVDALNQGYERAKAQNPNLEMNDYINTQVQSAQQQMMNVSLFNNLKGMVEKMDSTQAADFLSGAFGVSYADIQANNVQTAVASLKAGYERSGEADLTAYFNKQATNYQLFSSIAGMGQQMQKGRADFLQQALGVNLADVQAKNVQQTVDSFNAGYNAAKNNTPGLTVDNYFTNQVQKYQLYSAIKQYGNQLGDGFLQRIGVTSANKDNMDAAVDAVMQKAGQQPITQFLQIEAELEIKGGSSALSNDKDSLGGIDLKTIDIQVAASSSKFVFAPFDVTKFAGFKIAVLEIEETNEEQLLALAK